MSDHPRRARPPAPADFPVHRMVQTRWGDNDMYGHVNNVVHYALADSAVNAWLIESSGVDVRRLDALGVVAETGCQYLKELSFPATVDVGIAVDRLGTSSIVYRIALVETDAPHDLCALIRFVHVYV